MYCQKCGRKLPKNATLCAVCDQDKIKEYLENKAKEEATFEEKVETTEEVVEETNAEENTKEEVPAEPITEEATPVDNKEEEKNDATVIEENKVEEVPAEESVTIAEPKIKKSNGKFKKILLWIVIGLVLVAGVVVGGLIAYKKMGGSIKLSWNENYSDYNIDYIMPNKIKLGFDISNESKIDEVKIKTTCGSYEKPNSSEIIWDLTEASGDCKIEVSYKLKKISKKYHVFDDSKEKIEINYDEKEKIDYDSDEDLDNDGLTNKEEKKYKTDALIGDTDKDGLDDGYEIKTSKTDPTKADSDNDSLSDYDELKLELDPLKADSKGDGTKDGKRELTYNYEKDDVKITINGKGNIASTVAEINSNTKISGKKGLIDNLYLLHTDGSIKEATLTITYTDEELAKYGLNEDNLAIFYYNEKEAKYEKIDSVVDKNNKTVTATLKHFSPYVVGDSEILNETATYQVLFVLDNSWSMYTNEQYKKITGEEYSGGWFDSSDLAGNDADGVRFSLTSELVDKLSSDNYQIGVSEFRKDYANVLPIGSKKSDIKKKLPKMNGTFVTTTAGTNTSRGIVEGMKEFSDDTDYKYIIILTDGHDTETSYRKEEVIKKAQENNVKVCAIGFGEGATNKNLEEISAGTGCKFYASSDAKGLEELFLDVQTELNDDLVDINDDGEYDGILVADSGFIVNRDGFSFENYVSTTDNGGHCYGMATFAELYYKKLLPLKANDKKIGKDEVRGYDLSYSYFKNYTNNLYDFKFKSKALKYYGYPGYYKSFDIFDETAPADLYIVDKDKKIKRYNDKYKEEIENDGLFTIKTSKVKGNSDYNKKEWTILDDKESMQTSRSIENEDKQLFNALYYLLRKQDLSTYYSSAFSSAYVVRDIISGETYEGGNSEAFLAILRRRLNDNDPVVISTSNHGINAINLIQSLEDPNRYYIGVYDNNYPGEKRYLQIYCKNNQCLTELNGYYRWIDEKLRISPSLEEDLKYFEQK